MPKVKGVEMKVWEIERFAIRITHPDGKDVRGDKANMRRYKFEKMAPNDNTVEVWETNRFRKLYARFDVQVLYANNEVAPGNTKLGTVRDSYLD